ncbi:tRNA pseudouridine(38-40) synthase TruA [Alphaproteobacteria bacterium]|nr:tRNA pseudouridine(38-40) synthase TruA [Alphaproteobacteria bacterium]
MTRWKITIEYKGTNYYGWQRQEGLPTIQGSIERALKEFCQQDIIVNASGRTDAGVHAKAQIAHFDLDYGERPMDGTKIAKALNAYMRDDLISIIKAEKTDKDFHARHSATNKLYNYRIINRPSTLTVDQDLAWYYKRPLDPEAMHDAAQVLLGFHDFTTFRDSMCQAQSPEKTLRRLDVSSRDYDGCGGIEIIIAAEAKSFLHHQARNMVGSLTMVGERKWTKDDLKKALEAKDRKKGGVTAPADGLYLMRVDY